MPDCFSSRLAQSIQIICSHRRIVYVASGTKLPFSASSGILLPSAPPVGVHFVILQVPDLH